MVSRASGRRSSRPALKNQAAAFPGRGANRAGLDHVNYLAVDMPACGAFMETALGARLTERIIKDDGNPLRSGTHVRDKSYDLVYTEDDRRCRGRLHHIAFATDTREDILRAADVFLGQAGVHIETGPHKHAIQQTFFLYCGSPAATGSSCATRSGG